MILIMVAIILLCKPLPSLLCYGRDVTDEISPPTALLLAGCSSSSPLIPDIFLLSLYYEHYTAVPDTSQVDYNVNNAISNIVGGAHLQARVGYFGICVNPDGGSWLCSNNATALANEVSVDQDPLNLIWLASQFKDMIVFPYLM
jgi:Ca2+ regulator and membrane fusion protein Fig1